MMHCVDQELLFVGGVICNWDQFLCSGEDSLCIPKSWACDGVADCNGAEDEHNDTCGNQFQFLKANRTFKFKFLPLPENLNGVESVEQNL